MRRKPIHRRGWEAAEAAERERLRPSALSALSAPLRCGSRLSVLPAILLSLALSAPALAAAIPSAEGHVSAGLRAYKEGNLRAAAEEFRRAADLKPDSLDAHYYQGRIGLIQRDYYTAFASLKEVLALQKDYKNTQALFRQLTPPLLEQVRGELKVNPRSARAYGVLGFLLLYQKRTNEGITQLNYALRFDPSLATAYDDLAFAYYVLNRFEEALKYSERAFTLDPVRASITKHYQQLFYLKRAGFAADQITPDRFYSASEEPRSAGAGSQPPPESTGAESGSTAAAAELAHALQPDPPVPVAPVDSPPPPVDLSATPPADLTRIAIDDSAIVNAFLKDFKPKKPVTQPPSGASTRPAASGGGTASPLAEQPPSAAEIATRVRALYKKGKDLAGKTDFEGAVQAFELLSRIDPSYRDTMTQLETMRRYSRTKKNFDQAMDFYQGGSFAAALEMLRGIDLKTLREFREVPTLDHLTGECYFRSGKYQQAAEKLAKYCEENSKDVKFRYLLAKSYGELREHDKALEELKIIRNTDSSYLSGFPEAKGLRMKLVIKAYFPYVAVFALFWAVLSAGYFIYKVRQAASARKLKQTLSVAQTAQKESDWSRLLETCEDYEKQAGGPADVRLRQSKALALVNLGRLDQARQEVELLPDDARRQMLRAKLRLETGDSSEEALVDYRFLLGQEPNNLKLLQKMNDILQARGAADEEFARVLERLIELEPLKGEYVSQLAAIHLQRGVYDAAAQKTFEKLLTEDRANVRARLGLAHCHLASSHFVEAIREAKQVVEYDLENPQVHEILVDSYKHLEMIEEGEREYRRLLGAHPNHRALLDALARLREPADRPGGPVSEEELKHAYEKGARLFGEGHVRESLGPLSAAFDGNYQRTCAGALMVRAHLKLDESGTALRVFERMDVFDQPPDEFLLALCYEMAVLYEREHKPREAMRLYNFICRNNVNYRDAFQKLEALQAGR